MEQFKGVPDHPKCLTKFSDENGALHETVGSFDFADNPPECGVVSCCERYRGGRRGYRSILRIPVSFCLEDLVIERAKVIPPIYFYINGISLIAPSLTTQGGSSRKTILKPLLV
jgi:hypothetical protein